MSAAVTAWMAAISRSATEASLVLIRAKPSTLARSSTVSRARRALATSSFLASVSSASVTGASRNFAISARMAAMPVSGVSPAAMMA